MLAALLLADGRFPMGGHVHSAGVESAVADGRIVDVPTLAAYLQGRLHTTGLTEAALAAATVLHVDQLDGLDAEAEARITVPALRVVSRRLGRQLVRVAGRCWPSAILASLPDEPHQCIAFGAVGVAAGLDATDGLGQAGTESQSTRTWQIETPVDPHAVDGPGSVLRPVLLGVGGAGLLVVLVLTLPTLRASRRTEEDEA